MGSLTMQPILKNKQKISSLFIKQHHNNGSTIFGLLPDKATKKYLLKMFFVIVMLLFKRPHESEFMVNVCRIPVAEHGTKIS